MDSQSEEVRQNDLTSAVVYGGNHGNHGNGLQL